MAYIMAHHSLSTSFWAIHQDVTLTILRTDLEAPVEMPQMSMNHDKEERAKMGGTKIIHKTQGSLNYLYYIYIYIAGIAECECNYRNFE